MTAPCGSADCPVLAAPPTGLRTHRVDEGVQFHRGHKGYHAAAALVPGLGDTRFAPLDDTAHVYLATTAFAALLESALHSTAGVAPLVYVAELAIWAASKVTLVEPTRFIDLRDDELERLGIDRRQLVATSPTHYPCTRNLAGQLQGRVIGGQQTHGLLWNSRQAELVASALDHRPALRDMVDEHPSEVAVLWSPPAGAAPLTQTDLDVAESLGPLLDGPGREYVDDLTALLGLAQV